VAGQATESAAPNGLSDIAVEDDSADDFRRILGVNLVAAFLISTAAARHMRDQDDGGSIVNVISILGLVGLGQQLRHGGCHSRRWRVDRHAGGRSEATVAPLPGGRSDLAAVTPAGRSSEGSRP
jgi:NAD(P)-dependent dehydrogenase (short-subunit alcohol dehydrogenase family)